jgi:hypothetical protein
MAAAAVRLASQLFEDLGQTRVLFVGAGEMIELAATHFAARNPRASPSPTGRWTRRTAGHAIRRRSDEARRPCPLACTSSTP